MLERQPLMMMMLLVADVDECSEMLDNCHDDSFCTNTDDGFNCTCNPGFSGNGTFCEGKP